jgi:hypothetical protein
MNKRDNLIIILKILCKRGEESSSEALALINNDTGNDILEEIGDVINMTNDQIYLAWRDIEEVDDFTGWFWNRITDPKKVINELTAKKKVYAVKRR